MHFCKTKRHVWSKKEDAHKCCNGYKRMMVYGNDIPENTKGVNTDPETGMSYARVWIKQDEVSEKALL